MKQNNQEGTVTNFAEIIHSHSTILDNNYNSTGLLANFTGGGCGSCSCGSSAGISRQDNATNRLLHEITK